MKRILYPVDAPFLPRSIGGKARQLRFLVRNRFPVPPAMVLLWEAHAGYLADPDAALSRVRSELAPQIREDRAYAVRSSASVEDSQRFSFAGLFRTCLDVRGPDAVLEAVRLVWDSADSPEIRLYRDISGSGPVRMAVLVQEMVPARWSGVAFSRNPMTGLSETILEAVPGTSDPDGVIRTSPIRWVRKWGLWTERPDDGFPESLASEVADGTAAIARRFGAPVDVEWAWDGRKLFFLQVRPITRLDIPIFSNRISREMLPGIIKPLVWSVNTRLNNGAWVRILRDMTGERSLRPEDLTERFYGRAYFNMSAFGRVFERLGMPREVLELMLGLEQEGPDKPNFMPGPGILLRLPRMCLFAGRMAFLGVTVRRVLKTKEPRFRRLAEGMEAGLSREGGLSRAEWLGMADRLAAEMAPLVRISILVPLFAMMYYRMLGGLLHKQGIDVRRIELSGRREALLRYSPHLHLERLHATYFASDAPRSPEKEDELARDLDAFLRRFGHFSDSGNDFSSRPWRETPGLIARMAASWSPAPGSDAAGRSGSTPGTDPAAGTASLSIRDVRAPALRRLLIRWMHARASRFAVRREAVSSLYTYSYGQFRTCFLALGQSLAETGSLASPEDLFFLDLRELRDLAGLPDPAGPEADDFRSRIQARKDEMERLRDIPLPETIFGREPPPLRTEAPADLRGIPTSLGTYDGPARILRGLAEFDRLLPGDVLVIPYSDVGWSPLFARAGAVVAESGGILSHSSILAREYGIPAVVSVPGACRIPDGTRVSVNGHTGEILLLETS